MRLHPSTVGRLVAAGLALAAFAYAGGAAHASSSTQFQLRIQPLPAPGGGGGGGGGGGNTGAIYTTANLTMSGLAYPRSTVSLLKDGQVVARFAADDDARFATTIVGLAGGDYVFGLVVTDARGYSSPLITFPVRVAAGQAAVLSGIVMPPTLAVGAEPSASGDVVLSGQSFPAARIGISIDGGVPAMVSAGDDGMFRFAKAASSLAPGAHAARAHVFLTDRTSDASLPVAFTVAAGATGGTAGGCLKEDFDCDHHVDIVDFSVLAYWYERPTPPSYLDLNGDGTIDLVDFSILAFYWTG